MSDAIPTTPGHISPFESIRRTSDEGYEFWSARDLADVLGYAKWDKFKHVIERAQIACENSEQDSDDHFLQSGKLIQAGKGAQREIEDWHLSRYACYLIVQNADPSKEIVALGQTYFAVQTRRQEEADALAGLDEDQRRLYLRGQMADHNIGRDDARGLAYSAGEHLAAPTQRTRAAGTRDAAIALWRAATRTATRAGG